MSRQFKIALFIELTILAGLLSIGVLFWNVVCANSMNTCFKAGTVWSELGFLLLSTLRPLFFSPLVQAAYIGGNSFGVWWGTLLTALGAAFSALALYFPGHLIGKKIVRPWLASNLPSTWKLIRTQDYKIIFILRWIPIFPFDFLSLGFGIMDFHARRVFLFTFLGCIPEVFFAANLGSGKSSEFIVNGLAHLVLLACFTTVPLLIYEFFMRKRGTSLWTQLRRVYYELLYEARVNNEIIKRNQYSSERIPIILLYGFFSSRKTLAVMERLLTREGFDVMSFNLGGSLGVFFTRSIKDTAEFIDRKIRRQMTRYGFKKVHVVAHSKGGLVALYWLLRLGGQDSCDKIITMGTPFKGTWLTYLAIFTPLGFFWKDVWQMRPGCSFLKELHESPGAPGLRIYNFYSKLDRVAMDTAGIFEFDARVTPIPMHHLTHFQYLARRDVARTIVKILRDEPLNLDQPNNTEDKDESDGEEIADETQQIDSHKPAV